MSAPGPMPHSNGNFIATEPRMHLQACAQDLRAESAEGRTVACTDRRVVAARWLWADRTDPSTGAPSGGPCKRNELSTELKDQRAPKVSFVSLGCPKALVDSER